jgi:cell division cycle protein 37
MEEMKKEREIAQQKKYDNEAKLKSVKEKLAAETKETEVESLKKAIEELEAEALKIKIAEEELNEKEKKAPWNVDTISKSGFSKTVFNTKPKAQKEELTEEEREARMRVFIKENEKQLKEFGLLQKYDDSKKFLQERLHLVSEDTANYLVIWCINLQMEGVGFILLTRM